MLLLKPAGSHTFDQPTDQLLLGSSSYQVSCPGAHFKLIDTYSLSLWTAIEPPANHFPAIPALTR